MEYKKIQEVEASLKIQDKEIEDMIQDMVNEKIDNSFMTEVKEVSSITKTLTTAYIGSFFKKTNTEYNEYLGDILMATKKAMLKVLYKMGKKIRLSLIKEIEELEEEIKKPGNNLSADFLEEDKDKVLKLDKEQLEYIKELENKLNSKKDILTSLNKSMTTNDWPAEIEKID
jgi:hypothetical protein